MSVNNLNKLNQLKYLVSEICNSSLKKELEKWIDNNIVEYGYQSSINKQALIHLKDGKSKYKEYQKKDLACKLGQKVIENAVVENYKTEFNEVTTYRVLVIKS